MEEAPVVVRLCPPTREPVAVGGVVELVEVVGGGGVVGVLDAGSDAGGMDVV